MLSMLSSTQPPPAAWADEAGGLQRPRRESRLAGLMQEEEEGDNNCVVVQNPQPRIARDHLANARAAYQGYYRNKREAFAANYTALLPVGNTIGSTTQCAYAITYDEVPACRFHFNREEDLIEMTREAVQVSVAQTCTWVWMRAQVRAGGRQMDRGNGSTVFGGKTISAFAHQGSSRGHNA